MTAARELATVQAAARRAGCKIVSSSVGPHGHAVGAVQCADGWHAGRFLLALAELDARSPWAARTALEIRDGRAGDRAYVEAVRAFVRSRVRFVREAGEVFTGPAYTVRTGAGDCDDHARLVYALLEAGGVPARLAFLYKRGDTGPRHVVAQAWLGGAWRWLETTVDAAIDEHPLAAAERLGITKARADLAREVRTMSKDDLPGEGAGEAAASGAAAPATTMGELAATKPTVTALTGYLSPGFFRGVHAFVAEVRASGGGVTGEDLLAALSIESGVRPDVANHAGLPFYGLNQMSVRNLPGVGFHGSPAAYLALSAEDQWPFVARYFRGVAGNLARLSNGVALYLANFLPAYLDHADEPGFVLAEKGAPGFSGEVYAENAGLDVDGDGRITPADLAAALEAQKHGAKWNELVARYHAEGGEDGVSRVAGVVVALAMFGGAALLAARVASS